MPELRKDPVLGRWVIIATDRAKRLSDFDVVRQEARGGSCAFCEGHEEETPPKVYAVRAEGSAPNTPGQLRPPSGALSASSRRLLDHHRGGLPLARRADPASHAGGWLRVGLGLLHQPHAARGGCRGASRDGGLGKRPSPRVIAAPPVSAAGRAWAACR